jgi:integrase
MHLTDISIRNLRSPERGQVTYTDDTVTGFGVRVSQGGTKTFTLVYGDDRRRMTIGRVGVISLAEARQEAKRVLAEHTLGHTRPNNVRFDTTLAEYFADLEARVKRGENRPRILADYRRLINAYFNFGRTVLCELSHEDVTCKLPKAPGERSHALVAIKIFLSWAQKPPRRYIAHNPCEGMTVTFKPKRQRRLSDGELAAILKTALSGNDHYSRIIALLIFTGQRRGEIVALQREWFGKEQTITLPDCITKNKTQHTFPYGAMAADVIESVPRLNSTDYLFPAAVSYCSAVNGSTHMSWKPASRIQPTQSAPV